MHRRRHVAPALAILALAFSGGATLAVGCSATDQPNDFATGGGGSSSSKGGGLPTTTTGNGGSTSTGSEGGGGGLIIDPDGGMDAQPDVPMNPCGTECGPKELCDTDHLGLDDNCNGQVDEGCPCNSGQAHACFKGDPSYRDAPGCFDGTEKCTELGTWSDCIGGAHATDNCYANDQTACHAIKSVPFADVHLKDGTGTFGTNAVPGSETWTVACPAGVNPCPSVSSPDVYKALQSGEYTVTYTKQVAGDPNPQSCTYPLLVGARGLRVELDWEHDLGSDGVDLDLYVHKPMSTKPWSVASANPDNCMWSNCKVDDFEPPPYSSAPSWFPDVQQNPDDPVNWFLDPVNERNSCYFAPQGVGDDWAAVGLGCHNPRLDLDNITCDPGVLDVNDGDFCAPENINVDFPPKDQWTRVGVHYYSAHGLPYDVHPTVKIFCDGALAAELGPQGYYKGSTSKVTFMPTDAPSSNDDANRFWVVADVLFPKPNQCNVQTCVVRPIFGDDALESPLFMTKTTANASFGPPYAPIP